MFKFKQVFFEGNKDFFFCLERCKTNNMIEKPKCPENLDPCLPLLSFPLLPAARQLHYNSPDHPTMSTTLDSFKHGWHYKLGIQLPDANGEGNG